jgi:phosphatidylglycerophosphate synthase
VSSEKLVGAGGELAVAVRDAAGGVRRPADRDAAVADRNVGMVVLGLREVGEPVDESDRIAESVELERPLEAAVTLHPGSVLGHEGDSSLLERSRKPTPTRELVADALYRPLAHLVVLALLPLRVPPPAVVLAGLVAGLAAAFEIARGDLLAAAALVVLKTVLDGADGALARAAGRVTALGRYLDSDCDLVVNAALFAAIGYATGRPLLALGGFLASTLVLSLNFNLRRLYCGTEAMPDGGGLARTFYELVYAPQDRLADRIVRRRPSLSTLRVFHNLGLATQHTALAVVLVLVTLAT